MFGMDDDMDARQALNILYNVSRLHEMNGEDHDRVRQAGQVLQEFITESAKLESQVPDEDKTDG